MLPSAIFILSALAFALVSDSLQGGEHLVPEETELLAPTHRRKLLAVHLVPHVADGAVHHLGHMRRSQDRRVEPAQPIDRVRIARFHPMLPNAAPDRTGLRGPQPD